MSETCIFCNKPATKFIDYEGKTVYFDDCINEESIVTILNTLGIQAEVGEYEPFSIDIEYHFSEKELDEMVWSTKRMLSFDVEADIKRLEQFLEYLTPDDTKLVMNSKQSSILNCPHCNDTFAIHDDYEGVVTCPYCGKLVEQP